MLDQLNSLSNEATVWHRIRFDEYKVQEVADGSEEIGR